MVVDHSYLCKTKSGLYVFPPPSLISLIAKIVTTHDNIIYIILVAIMILPWGKAKGVRERNREGMDRRGDLEFLRRQGQIFSFTVSQKFPLV